MLWPNRDCFSQCEVFRSFHTLKILDQAYLGTCEYKMTVRIRTSLSLVTMAGGVVGTDSNIATSRPRWNIWMGAL